MSYFCVWAVLGRSSVEGLVLYDTIALLVSIGSVPA